MVDHGDGEQCDDGNLIDDDGWEWTSTLYDALAYADQAAGRIREDEGRIEQPDLRVLRGGSWADSAAAVTLSLRTAQRAGAGNRASGRAQTRQTWAFD